jgi:hypothetical protein
MAEDRLKFRCYRCNQLLSTSPKRVGKEISCPRCKAELVVPELDAEPAPVEARAPAAAGRPDLPPRKRPREVSEGPAKAAQVIEDIAAAIPEDLVALRPEDIRVEAEFVDLVVTTTEPETPAPWPNLPVPVEAQPRPAATEEDSAKTTPQESPQLVLGPDADPAPSAVDAGINAILPAINIEPPTILPPDREIRHVREVILQPSTVLAWSLLVLLSIPMAFIAGLLIGHFLWK